jgi:hypothetical protein
VLAVHANFAAVDFGVAQKMNYGNIEQILNAA